MNLIITLLLSTITFLSVSAAETILPEREAYSQLTIEIKSKTPRYRLEGDFIKSGTNTYLLNEYGAGNYSDYNNITWHLKSKTALEGGGLLPLSTDLTIKNSDEKIIFSSQQTYDQAKNTVTVFQEKENDEEIKEFIFKIKGLTTDYASLVYFLRIYLPKLISGEPLNFYFLSSEPGMYKLQAHLLGQETITIGEEKINAVKIGLTPAAGILNLIIDRFVPPTLLWYAHSDTYPWLQYEGLESGRGSSYIRTTIEKIDPPL